MKRLPDLYCTTLGTLPSELFDIVLGHISGDFRSLKRLRLSGTTRSHDEVILEHLFRRVSLSMLKSSVDEFTSIAANPHLARHVRVLVWQELPSYTGRLCMFDADGRLTVVNRRYCEIFDLPPDAPILGLPHTELIALGGVAALGREITRSIFGTRRR